MNRMVGSAHPASGSAVLAGLARFGLACRAFVYLMIGWLAVEIAVGGSRHEANQRGALADVAQQSYGVFLLWALGIGFAAYALWRLVEAAVGTPTDGRKIGPRLQCLVRGIVYIALAVTTFSVIAGSSDQRQAQQQQSLTARVMRHTGGRWLVGAVGLIVVVVGAAMIVEGVRQKFTVELRMDELHGRTRRVILGLGVVGTTARGVVFGLAGILTLSAAITFDPRTSSGVDGALRTLAHQPFGSVLLGITAVGLIAFGGYGFALARYART